MNEQGRKTEKRLIRNKYICKLTTFLVLSIFFGYFFLRSFLYNCFLIDSSRLVVSAYQILI